LCLTTNTVGLKSHLRRLLQNFRKPKAEIGGNKSSAEPLYNLYLFILKLTLDSWYKTRC
jgi:hypothetical protein